jgi:Domain of unknown function (DUF1990)
MTDLRLRSHPDPRQQLARLRTRGLNFDPHRDGPFTADEGWRIDEYRRALPPEPPGAPVARGSWEVARKLSEDYAFVDPRLVRAFYDPREPLAGRTILLEIHFWGLRVYAGVRAGPLEDATREQDGRQARVWAWNYRTLEDHFEVGQIDYEVWKWLDSGQVEFRVQAFSRPARIGQPIVRLGFRLFGRGTQVRFARSACDRMASLTQAAIQEDAHVEAPTPVAPDLVVWPDPCKDTTIPSFIRRLDRVLSSRRR